MILDSPGPILSTSESYSIFKTANDPEERLKARYELLASLPLPEGVPDDELKPLVLPGSMTIKEFILSACNVRPPFTYDFETHLPRLASVSPTRVLFCVIITSMSLTSAPQVVKLPHPSRAYDCLVSRSRGTWLHVDTHFQVLHEPTDCDGSQLECRGRHRTPCEPHRMLLQQRRKVVLRRDVPGG
jgi:hypothetical protein